jgi:hypothetical protein
MVAPQQLQVTMCVRLLQLAFLLQVKGDGDGAL